MLIHENKYSLWTGSAFPFLSFPANPGKRGPSKQRPHQHFQFNILIRPYISLHKSCTVDRSSFIKRKMVRYTLQKLSQRGGLFHYTWNNIPTYKRHFYCPFQSYRGKRVTAIDRAI